MATTELTGKNFQEHVEKPGILVIDWWATWCGPCRAFAPIYEKASEKHTDVVFGKIDTDVEQELAMTFEIRSIPTVRSVHSIQAGCRSIGPTGFRTASSGICRTATKRRSSAIRNTA